MATHSPPREAAAARAAVTAACLNVAFVLLLLAFAVGFSRLFATRGDIVEASSSSAFHNSGGPAGDGDHDSNDRCGDHAGAGDGDDGYPYPRGYVDYLYLFYCVLGGERRRALAYGFMAAWLAVLFYLLGDTAAAYFCSSLEGLSRLLRLPPAVAGATLLSLGNGAPDALSTVASFAAAGGGGGGGSAARRTAASVGLHGVLGGAMFVSSAVLGVIGLRVGGRGVVAVDRGGFFRDAAFFLLALAAVAVVLAVGEVTIWGAGAFISLYLAYVLAVAFTATDHWSTDHLHLPAEEEGTDAAGFSELHSVAETKFYEDQEAQDYSILLPADAETVPLLQHYTGDSAGWKRRMASAFWTVVRALDQFLRLPRRLTIPDASKERWSKPTAVTAATLAPILLSWLCRHHTAGSPLLAVLVGALAGLSLGTLAFLTTDPASPPTRLLGAWLAGGFVMSVAWAYVLATEVLSLLVSAGAVLSVDAAALGVLVLAWGNSLGDLVTNVAVAASSPTPRGAQVAVSGCYGGPVFSMLVGMGLSMLLSCWAMYPRPFEVPRDAGLYRTLGFVAAGVLWAAVVLTRKGMRVDRTLGLGLLAIYFCFLCVNVSQVLGPKGSALITRYDTPSLLGF